ncbi:amidase [Ensifer sp. ENS09]|uniref:amidase n=1 Tax=Ensifer sp. ENS09 TaxID=2769263 RepID=UPI00177B73B2|nr:amidase family protein [Ensifer sp. ENS09]MBD9651819.1 amidase [Ensifer sp. ENS09]
MRASNPEHSRLESDDFSALDATEQAHLVSTGEASPLELVEAAIRRIERREPHVNALASTDFDHARKCARAFRPQANMSFAGVPTLLKDLLAYPGHAAGFGSRLFKGQPAQGGSDYTDALDKAGLIVLGKTTTSEFGLLGTTETLAHGATRNPWNFALSTGGSSGGAVAAVASGMVPIAHASDGGGSIRGPSSFCGLFGFKPSRDRTVNAGLPPAMPTARLISDHCVSRSVRDSAAWLAATERLDLTQPLPAIDDMRRGPQKRLRIGVYRHDVFGRGVSEVVEDALNATITLCTALGHEVLECVGPDINAQETSRAFFNLTGIVLSGLFDQIAAAKGGAFDETLFEPYTVELVSRARRLPETAITEAIGATMKAGASANQAISGYHVLLSPTVPFTAFPLGTQGPTEDPDQLIAFTERLAGFTNVASFAGWPAMSVPLFWSPEGLPVGCHFAAAAGEDALLLSLAFQLEEAAPWQPRLVELAGRLACLSV